MPADMHTANKERSPVPRCWLKKRMLITHIAGDNSLTIIDQTDQLFRSILQLVINVFFCSHDLQILIRNVQSSQDGNVQCISTGGLSRLFHLATDLSLIHISEPTRLGMISY